MNIHLNLHEQLAWERVQVPAVDVELSQKTISEPEVTFEPNLQAMLATLPIVLLNDPGTGLNELDTLSPGLFVQ